MVEDFTASRSKAFWGSRQKSEITGLDRKGNGLTKDSVTAERAMNGVWAC